MEDWSGASRTFAHFMALIAAADAFASADTCIHYVADAFDTPGVVFFTTLVPDDVTIWWGAYLGMPHEALIAGPLVEAGPAITRARARLRADHGWIMDTYLLRRPGSALGNN